MPFLDILPTVAPVGADWNNTMKKMVVVAESTEEVGSVEEYREKVRLSSGGRPKVHASMRGTVKDIEPVPTIGEKFAGR